eukprot:1271656-Rhodomonas_salina.2
MQLKQAAKAILFDDKVVDCLRGEQLSGLKEAVEKPWTLLVITVWLKMLFRYEGINECIDANFVKDYNDTTMHSIGKNSEDVAEVQRCIKMQLQVPRKVFTTVDALCDHLELCSMMTIIADAAKQGCRAGATWQLAENQIIT